MARTERQSAAPSRGGVTPAQLREAERGLRLILAATFPPVWIAQNVREVLAEANADYVAFVRDHGPARNPTGWLIERARLRALNLVARENRRSGPPLESVIGSTRDPEPTPEETALERDRHRRIADALSELPEKERKLLALVYFEGRSIRGAGRLLGWGKSNADYHHKEAMRRLRALVGPRDLLSPALVGLLARATALHEDRRSPLGGIANRLSALAEDLTDLVAGAAGSASRNAGEAIRRAVPFADTGTAAVSGGGAGRLIAQCGALATAVICSAIVVSSPPVDQVLPHPHSGSEERRPGRSDERSGGQESSPPIPTPSTAPSAEEASRSSAAARSEEASRIERRHRRRARRRRRRRTKIARARRARKAKARARASRAKRNESIEAPEEVAPEVTEPAPETETVVPEAEPAPPSPPPPATGAQTRGEFGL